MSIVSAILYLLAFLVAAAGVVVLWIFLKIKIGPTINMTRLGPEAPVLQVDGLSFRDLNKNGRLDPYEDRRRPIEERVEDLLGQMTLEEKVGLMMHPMISAGENGELVESPSFVNPASTSEMVVNRHIKHFNIVAASNARVVAVWHNKLQKMAERTRLGIPVTVSSDPRHAATDNPGTGIRMENFSYWPDPLGLAAARDEALVQGFGDIARQEYIAVGIRTALHPMADLATEPRWARMSGTFGEGADLASRLTAAYIRGFQGDRVGPESVSCMVKHFPGGGPQKEGWDPHFSYGREQAYPGDNFDYHLIPFEAAFAAGVEQVMPYYGIPVGQTSEDVAMGYNRDIVTGLLREKYGFDGVICSDWMIVETGRLYGLFKTMNPTSWGVEHLSVKDRYRKALEAGIDQFGGQLSPRYIVELVREGQVAESRIDDSVRRILKIKFELGLFDNPYVDLAAVDSRVGTPEFREAGVAAQRRSVVLLKNGFPEEGEVLPLNGRPKLYLENIAPETAQRYGQVVASAEEADFAILRLRTPHQEPRGKSYLERFFHQGDLDFKDEEKERILKVLETTPTIVDIHLERAAVIPEIAGACMALLATFGVEDEVVLDAIFGVFRPTGKLPVEMPSSMAAVRSQKEDVPYDSEDPLFPYGHGLEYL
jgi:beta-glucosidase